MEFTQESMKKLNGEGYQSDDNRTYTSEPLSYTPWIDVKHHLSILEDKHSGNVLISTELGSFFGSCFEETKTKAENRVFFFPKASSFYRNVKLIETSKMTTLYPTWFIKRYKIKEKFFYSQKTNIYYDVKSARFFIVMDERFFDEISVSEVLLDKEGINATTYSGKDGKTYLAIYADTISDLKSEMIDKGKAFDQIHNRYKQHFLNLQDLERVIVLRYDNENQDTNLKKHTNQFTVPNISDRESVYEHLYRQKMEFEFFQAAKTDDGLFYLIDEDTGLIQSKSIIYIKESETSVDFIRTEKQDRNGLLDGGDTFIIMPYSDKDWDLIKVINEKLISLCTDLESLFQSTKTEIGILDKPITQAKKIGMSVNLLPSKD